jgi:hypothetical protein
MGQQEILDLLRKEKRWMSINEIEQITKGNVWKSIQKMKLDLDEKEVTIYGKRKMKVYRIK